MICSSFIFSVLQTVIRESAKRPPVINIFCPLMTHRSPLSSAKEDRAPRTSVPPPGSVNAMQDLNLPSAISGRYFSFCSLVPNSPMKRTPNPAGRAYRQSNRHGRLADLLKAYHYIDHPLSPAPRIQLGTAAPNIPRSANFCQRSSGGKSTFSSIQRTYS